MTEWPKGWLSVINWRLGVPKLPGRPQSAGSRKASWNAGLNRLVALQMKTLCQHIFLRRFPSKLSSASVDKCFRFWQVVHRLKKKISAERLPSAFLERTSLCCFVRSKIAVNCLSSREYWEVKPSCFWSAEPKPCKHRGLPLISTIKRFLFVNLKPSHHGEPSSRSKGPRRN